MTHSFEPSASSLLHRKWIALYLSVAAIYLLTSSGRIAGADGLAMFNVTQSIATERTLSAAPCTPTARSNHCVPGIDGRLYAGFGLGPSIAVVPAYIVGAALASKLHRDRKMLTGMSVLFLHGLFSAAVPVLLALWLYQIGISWPAAATAALVYAFATPFWVHGVKAFCSEPYFSLGLLGCCYLISREDRPLTLLGAGACFGFAVASRIYGLILLPAVVAYALLVWRSRSVTVSQMIKNLLWAGLSLGVFLLLIAESNLARFGSVSKTGYQLAFPTIGKLLGNPLLNGMRGLLISGEVGVLPFIPWVLALPLIWIVCYRRFRNECILVLGVNLIAYLFFAKYADWHGGDSFGPRLLLPTLPLLVLPLAVLFDRGRAGLRTWKGRITVGLVVLSLLIELVTVAYPLGRYYRLRYSDYLQGRTEWWTGYLIPMVVVDLPNIFSTGINGNVNDPGYRYLLSLENSVNMLRPDLWLFKAWLFGLPWPAAVLLAALLLLLFAVALRAAYRGSTASCVEEPRSVP